jgi:hypothetical protein
MYVSSSFSLKFDMPGMQLLGMQLLLQVCEAAYQRYDSITHLECAEALVCCQLPVGLPCILNQHPDPAVCNVIMWRMLELQFAYDSNTLCVSRTSCKALLPLGRGAQEYRPHADA